MYPETRPDCRQAHRQSVSATFYLRSVAADELAVGPLPDRLLESQAEKRMGATPTDIATDYVFLVLFRRPLIRGGPSLIDAIRAHAAGFKYPSRRCSSAIF